MADRNSNQQRSPTPNSITSSFLRKLHLHSPNSAQVVGILTFIISGAVLLLLTGLTVTALVLGLIFFAPLIIFTSPIWVPLGTILFVVIAGFLSVCGFGVAVVVGLSWLYRYFKGMHPPGSDRVDHARSRIYNTASHVKDYAREYGGYLQSKVKDAAPGA
ncbi:Oleosin family protein [Tripterygium wilfordii]|uniref:Oleosin family protein n=1 Tax=Tripterygium wilfordii TaxID=458696 RepID=A0A7J7CJ59_TRIWF|nr:oleosin G [Tripterygium wilfordii]KAF5734074.1 Oleosin family protein [Tripterygium wilfordii]